ncbi:MAG: PadR family transcriptional regulator [Desulfurococcales archaeon]|nr:PadR family transcriptional regulator [Desulfurococcales archaeon]
MTEDIGPGEYLGEEWLGEEEDQEYSGESWDRPARPGRGPRVAGVEYMKKMGEDLENQTLIADPDLLAAELLTDRRILGVFLALAARPRQAGELLGVRVWSRWKEKARKTVRERDSRGWGYREVERTVEEEKQGFKRVPASTLYKLLQRLAEAGLVEAGRGLDKRRRYYKLTDRGREVLGRVKMMIHRALYRWAQEPRGQGVEAPRGHRVLRLEDFQDRAREIGVEPRTLLETLGLRVEGERYSRYVLIPPVEEKPQRDGGRQAYTW